MKTWVIIPAYNEADRMPALLHELKARGFLVLVIDDGSSDETAALAASFADRVIRNEHNLGKGMSLQKGISLLLKEEDFDCVVTMDADGQHLPEDIGVFLELAQVGAQFIVGNRMVNPVGMPKIRVCTNKLMSWFLSQLIGQKIPDTQCGFRLVHRDLLERLQIRTQKFEVESEFLIQTARLGVTISSVPIRSVYFRRPQSKINPFLDTLRFLRFIFTAGYGKK